MIVGGARPPFVMLGAGNKIASLIESHLDQDRPVYVLAADWGHADLERYTSVEQLAERNLTELRSLQPVGAYLLGGYSMGAPIALEMAQHLRLAGENVELLFLLDPPGRAVSGSGPGLLIGGPRNEDAGILSSQSGRSSTVATHLARISALPMAAKFRYVICGILTRLRGFASQHIIRPTKTGLAVLCRSCGLKVPTALRKNYVGAVYTDAWSRYEFKPYDGSVVIFYSSTTSGDRQVWENVTGGELTIEWFEGGHLEFYQNSELMNRWTSRLVELLTSYQTRGRAGNSDGIARGTSVQGRSTDNCVTTG